MHKKQKGPYTHCQGAEAEEVTSERREERHPRARQPWRRPPGDNVSSAQLKSSAAVASAAVASCVVEGEDNDAGRGFSKAPLRGESTREGFFSSSRTAAAVAPGENVGAHVDN